MDPPVRFAVVHESARTRVTRLSRAGRTLIMKEPLGPDAGRRLRHESAILERMRGVTGVAQLADESSHDGTIVLADAGESTLADLPKPLPAHDLAGFALALARAMAEVHRREVIHRDLTPANIVVAADGTPTLVDFGLAASIAEIRPEFTHHNEIPGTLAYLAPEQTGRTGRAVDQRADLYALGAVLYELGTGEPPFGTGDPLRLIHDHLARLPDPPADLPEPLSKIILHLLEKEPDNRYQSADGLVHDLSRMGDEPGRFRVGERDFPVRLLPPSRLVGRDEPVAVLKAAFAEALAGRCAGVVISGVPGVGKTALTDELRPVVTASGGWFVAGKFDEYRRDQEFNAVQQAFTSFGRLLLAEPEDEVAPIRVRMLRALGANAGLLATVVPEFATLLGPGELGDPLTAGVRAQMVAAGALRAVASKRRPLVVFIDDLQWGGGVPLGFVDMVLSNEGSEGLLLVAAYREGHVDPSHALAAMLERWSEAAVPHVALENLTGPDLVAMLSETLHVAPAAADELGEVLQPHCHGNPYETVELLNALRRDGVLTAAPDGWRWDPAAVRAHLTQAEAGGLSAARVAAMPERSRRAVEAMACLGGRAKLSVLEIAIAAPGEVPDLLEPALRDGILATEAGAEDAVRFRHDRIREDVLNGLGPDRRAELHLAMARRLAAEPSLFAVAAEQYLPVAAAVTEPGERRAVSALLRRAADEVAQIGEFALVHALLSAALTLADDSGTDALIELHTLHHAALFSLGRLDEADDDYRALEGLAATVLDRRAATALQVKGLTHRNRFTEAIELVIRSLRECGIDVPDDERMPAAIDRQFARLYDWLDHTDLASDMARPDLTDPALLTAGSLLNAMLAPVYFVGDQVTYSWAGLEALRIWTEHGPGHTLVGSAANAAFHAITRSGDYTAAYRTARRILALGESRSYEPDTSHARLAVSFLTSWFEPVENSIQESLRAREGLTAGGDLSNASYTYHQTVVGLLDCGPVLDACMAQVNAAQAFARRTGSGQTSLWLESYDWLADVLRRTGSAAAAEPIPIDRYAGNPLVVIHVHLCRAIAAAIFGDPAELARQGAAAVRLLPVITGFTVSALAHPLYGLGLAGQARSAHGDERAALLTELDDVLRWLGARAADAPDNFLHLLRLVEAEQAWAMGDFRAAAFAYDSARREVEKRQRPWHRALIAERAGHFYLAHGLEHTGYELLAQAREQYLAWGAPAKAEQMEWAYPGLNPSPEDGQADDHPRRATVTAGATDLLGILSASRALSSETSVEHLHARVAEVLSAMTGATGVDLVLWDEAREDWLLPGGPAAPMSVLRYLHRTQEPLAVSDATTDDRFARDPYFDGLACCSLLAVPVLGRGALRAVLLLENRLIRGAFTTGRLEAVGLIAGQLAVSLDNAQLYAGYRRIADEQAALRRVATLVARAEPPDAVFATVAAEAGQLLGVDFATLIRYDESEMMEIVGMWTAREGVPPTPLGTRLPLGGTNVTTLVFNTQRAARIYRAEATGPIGQIAIDEWGWQAAVGVPISAESRLWGVLLAGSIGDESPPPDSETRLSAFAELVATAIANAEARAEVAASRARIVAAADQARQRIERDLHDGAQQRLVSLALWLREAQAAVPPGLEELRAQLVKAVASANDALEEVHEIARGIHPAVLATGGLRPALHALARRSTIPVRLDLLADQRLPEPVEVSVYYIVAEALTNAAKHARASAVSIHAEVVGDLLRVTVTDDGTGGAVVGGGTGLVGLKDRVEALGGRLRVNSPDGGGTRLTAELPITTASTKPGQ
ncbi:AAA family ATPase [Actinoplanes sp. TBRC 11911]|uniref:protein kinase domain-containing protein n=1 Tax=Actinoplanes sp. TBRC 11911 TaxID=2729386 RepID=UPI00145F4D36|nr:AAA family ATPase [Actinoplanes sp. TBRC 11911]NMO50055.1 AAA family ATPase [Actinoplanes sp. TBRC 11911]